jgi:hypothetical protein
MQRLVTGRLVRVPAEALGWSLAPRKEGLAGLPNDEKTSPKYVHRGSTNYPLHPMAAPHAFFAKQNRLLACRITAWLFPGGL